jgi:hypothetical protein
MTENNYFEVHDRCYTTRICKHQVTLANGKSERLDGIAIYKLYLDHGLEPPEHFARYEKNYKHETLQCFICDGDFESLKTSYTSTGFSLIGSAVVNNNLDTVKYLVEEKDEKVNYENLKQACDKTDIVIFDYLESREVTRDKQSYGTLIEHCVKSSNLEMLQYLIEKKEHKIESSKSLMVALKKNDEKPTDTTEMVVKYLTEKTIEQKARIDPGSDVITLLRVYPLIFAELLEHGLVDEFTVAVDVSGDYTDVTNTTEIPYLDRHLNEDLKRCVETYCLNNENKILLPHFRCDIASMSVEFEYIDSTICEELRLVFNHHAAIGIPCTKPNLFETNFVSSLHVACILYMEIGILVKTSTKNFKSIKINVKFDDTHAGADCGYHQIEYQLTPDKSVRIHSGLCDFRDIVDEAMPDEQAVTKSFVRSRRF